MIKETFSSRLLQQESAKKHGQGQLKYLPAPQEATTIFEMSMTSLKYPDQKSFGKDQNEFLYLNNKPGSPLTKRPLDLS